MANFQKFDGRILRIGFGKKSYTFSLENGKVIGLGANEIRPPTEGTVEYSPELWEKSSSFNQDEDFKFLGSFVQQDNHHHIQFDRISVKVFERVAVIGGVNAVDFQIWRSNRCVAKFSEKNYSLKDFNTRVWFAKDNFIIETDNAVFKIGVGW